MSADDYRYPKEPEYPYRYACAVHGVRLQMMLEPPRSYYPACPQPGCTRLMTRVES